MKEYVLLKQSFPTSKFDRKCDGYEFIIENTTVEERKKNDIDIDNLKKIIKKDEKYLYRVGKENGVFKDMCISLHNFEIIREKFYIFEE
jgi:hypothetical protein